MASAPELASVHDLASASDVASVPDVPSVQDEVSLPDVAPVPNGHSVSNGVSATPSVPDGLGNSPVANGTSVSNGVSATPSVPDGLENSPVANGTSTTSSPSAPANLSIAIIGGGIGGICLAIGLLKHAHINVQIYEAAPKWVQIGAALGFGPNAQAALELLGPETAAAFKKNVTGNLWESHKKTFMNFYAGHGRNAGKTIHTQKSSTGLQSCQRVEFVNDLVKCVPKDRVHMGKRLVYIQDQYDFDGPVILHFADGTIATADAVIGADGIHSYVREFLIGQEEAKPVFSGFVAYRGLVPMDAAIEKLGAEVAQNTSIFCGPGRALLCSPADDNKVLLAAANPEIAKWEHEKWNMPAEWEELSPLFEGWGPHACAILELLKGPELAKWAIWDTKSTSTYTKGRVALMGDAAHATTPWQGQGAGQAIEDALVLTHLLTDSSTHPNRSELPNVFYAYDQIRRPRTQRVVKTSREAGLLFAMRQAGVEGDLKKMSDELGKRMHWIWHRDLKAQNRAAAELFVESL